ncbi:hypothetical protein G3I15_03130, partial [Streptomyces sp. SID10244]|nr:hypothetical protein [Streptomyces sp. SID10244]
RGGGHSAHKEVELLASGHLGEVRAPSPGIDDHAEAGEAIGENVGAGMVGVDLDRSVNLVVAQVAGDRDTQ